MNEPTPAEIAAACEVVGVDAQAASWVSDDPEVTLGELLRRTVAALWLVRSGFVR